MILSKTHTSTLFSSLSADAEAGRKVQRHFMPPQQADFEGYTFGYRVHSKMPVSGDFVDYAYFGDGLMLFFVLDVSGHGTGSGLIGLMVSQLIRRCATSFLEVKSAEVGRGRHLPHDACVAEWPAKILTIVNRELLQVSSPCHFTGVLGVLDLNRHRLHYTVAGHHPFPVFIGHQGAAFLESHGKPVGLFREVSWLSRSISFVSGQHLAILTDGIWPFIEGSSTLEKEGYLLDWLGTQLMMDADSTPIKRVQNRATSAFDHLVAQNVLTHSRNKEREGDDLAAVESMLLKGWSSTSPCSMLLDDDVSLLVISRGE